MEKGALSDARFGEFAERVVLFLHDTSHVDTDPYQSLLRDKGGSGFPYLVWMDADGDVLAKQPGRERTVEDFVKFLEHDVAAARARKLEAAKEPQARVAWLMQQVDFGAGTVAEIEQAMRELRQSLSPEQLQKLEQLRDTKEVYAAMQGVYSQASWPQAGPKMLALRAAGHVPKDEQPFTTYRNVLLAYAEQQHDVKLFEQVLQTLRERYAGNERSTKQIVVPLEARLEKLRRNAAEEKQPAAPADAASSGKGGSKTEGPAK